MTAISNYLETQILTWACTASAATRPTAWHVALFTAAPSDTGGGTELSTGGYARQSVTFTVSGATASNTAIIDFVSSGDWGNITHVGIFDASTAGNLLFWGALSTPRDPASGDTVRFAASALQITLD
jgi:hypothetical protein